MQDIHSIGSGAPRLFSGAGDGDRRIRPHHQHHHGQVPQVLKCPRCESSNTKFCYYNNYNLSQPRHFCKSCRRYWTKGGVLRNVPVGGGCRKKAWSKSKSTRVTESTVRKSTANSNSSSESSSLTATTTTTTTTTTATETVPAVINFQKTSTEFVNTRDLNPSFNVTLLDDTCNESNLFSDIGPFTSMITTPPTLMPAQLDVSPFKMHHAGLENLSTTIQQQQHQEQRWLHTEGNNSIGHDELKVPETSPLEFMDGQTGHDWNNDTDQTLFDLTGDHQSYWSQAQWDDHNHENDHQLNYLR